MTDKRAIVTDEHRSKLREAALRRGKMPDSVREKIRKAKSARKLVEPFKQRQATRKPSPL